MMVFCTLFDSNYLTRGIAMIESLNSVSSEFRLYVIAFDQKCLDILSDLKLSNVEVISLKEFENERLLSIKNTRSRGEYCWTCASSSILYILEKYNVDHCVYIDADLFFYTNPEIIFQEWGDQSIIITEHGYSSSYRTLINNGIYCVQFVGFKKNDLGLIALKWWVDACIDWCYARHENGKFGDQKYLDDWTTRFQGVHVLKNQGGGVAPWNVLRFDFYEEKKQVKIIDKKTKEINPLIFYHFHDLKFFTSSKIQLTGGYFNINKKYVLDLYYLYIKKLYRIKKIINDKDNSFDPNGIKKMDNKSGIVDINKIIKRIRKPEWLILNPVNMFWSIKNLIFMIKNNYNIITDNFNKEGD